VTDFNRRYTSRPIGEELLTTGERARRAAVVAAVYPIDMIDAFRIHEYMAGHTDTPTGAWAGIESIVALDGAA
jgi:hypothetical protein